MASRRYMVYDLSMPLIKKTLQNPHGLSSKQRLVIDAIVSDVQQGKKIDAVKNTEMIYNTSSKNSTAVQSSKNLNSANFREALIEQLSKAQIIGNNSRIAKGLNEGLEAVTTGKFGGEPDHRTRLSFIQEVNKITGVYAPEKTESKTLKINVNMSSEELQDKINQLQHELTES